MRGMTRPAGRKRGVVVSIEPFEVQHAANTISQAQKHLANPKMMKAVRAHIDSMNAAVSGGLKPKPMRSPTRTRGKV